MPLERAHFLLLQSAEDFRHGSTQFRWNEHAGAFTLTQEQELRLPSVAFTEALTAWVMAPPRLIDPFGRVGELNPDRTRFVHRSSSGGPSDAVLAGDFDERAATASELSLAPVEAPDETHFVDLYLGGDGVVALPFTDDGERHGLMLVHLRERWRTQCELSARPRRVAVDRAGRAWVLMDGALAMCVGRPLPHPYTPDPKRFEPEIVNPNQLREHFALPLGDDIGLGVCTDAEHVYLLSYQELGDSFVQHISRWSLAARGKDTPERFSVTDEAPFAVDIGLVETGRLALLSPPDPTGSEEPHSDLPVVELNGEAATTYLVKERYPTINLRGARFVSALDGQLRYDSERGPRRLVGLPQAQYPTRAEVVLALPLDAFTHQTLWDRVYLEACIPRGCELRVSVRVFEDPEHPAAAPWLDQPKPVWTPMRSELPFRDGHWQPEAGRKGLFEILLQRPNGEVRELRGRYLQLRLAMSGDGRHSPAVHAIRAYYPRVSWQEAYLPVHFHQLAAPSPGTESDPSDDEPANGADFRQRLLSSLEGIFVPIENRIATSEALADPMAMPEAGLDELGRMLGEAPPAHWPLERRRNWFACIGDIQRYRGTLLGLNLALDIATDGAVRAGRVVVLENFRFRRTLGTVLGVDLNDPHHPLTLGTAQSGNSLVGETLILSAEHAREFLALLAPELAEGSASDQEKVEAFFDRYSHRLTILLHGSTSVLENAVREIVSEHVPAHLKWDLRVSEHPFVLGLSPLLQIDTFLERSPAWRRVVLNDTYLTREGILQNPVALAPYWSGATPGELGGR